MDHAIRFFDAIGNPILLLLGHEKGIISFSWSTSGQLISGSWDGTARVWDFTQDSVSGQIIANSTLKLGPHENGVHVLGGCGGNTIVTTSTGESVNERPANFQIRLWNGSTGQQLGASIKDHGGSIRCICAVPGVGGFATGANDGCVNLRASDGSVIGSMFHPCQEDGSPPFVLDW